MALYLFLSEFWEKFIEIELDFFISSFWVDNFLNCSKFLLSWWHMDFLGNRFFVRNREYVTKWLYKVSNLLYEIFPFDRGEFSSRLGDGNCFSSKFCETFRFWEKHFLEKLMEFFDRISSLCENWKKDSPVESILIRWADLLFPFDRDDKVSLA